MYKIGVLGAGSWGTALVKILTEGGQSLHWWHHREEVITHIQNFKHNPRYLSSVQLPISNITLYTDINQFFSTCDAIILAVPSAFLHTALQGVDIENFKDKKFISAIKGIVPEYNLIIGDYLQKHYNVPESDFSIICGPCHAEEVALEKKSYLTVAGQDEAFTQYLATQLQNRYIKTTLSTDVYGAEYASVLKNVYAIAAGICHGLGYGDNFQSVLISNALQEIKRFVDVVYPQHRDVNHTAYMGDLLVTAYSQFSRNRTFGNMIGKGYSVKSTQMEMNMIAEGYYATACIHAINEQYGVDMPIANATNNILYKGISPAIEMKKLEDKMS